MEEEESDVERKVLTGSVLTCLSTQLLYTLVNK